jgi:hypothetical protein
MRIITSDNAHSMMCCTADRTCKGDRCMAWVDRVDTSWRDLHTPNSHSTQVRTHPDPKLSGKGYCGMVSEELLLKLPHRSLTS